MRRIFFQLIRFVGIGFINTALNFAVLNIFMAATGLSRGTPVGIFSVIAFTVAVLHSYFWNKNWAFNLGDVDARLFKNAWQFAVSAALGLAVWVAVVVGAGRAAGTGYYLLLVALLAVGEVLMWQLFHLGQTPVPQKTSTEFLYFIVISAVGALINFFIVKYGTIYVPPRFGFNQPLWTDGIQAVATGVSLIWNFLGYKILVFKD